MQPFARFTFCFSSLQSYSLEGTAFFAQLLASPSANLLLIGWDKSFVGFLLLLDLFMWENVYF